MTTNKPISLLKISAIILVASALAACGGSGGGSADSNPDAGAAPQPSAAPTSTPIPTPSSSPSPSASLERVQADVFDRFCVGCHAGEAAPRGLQLESETISFNALVNKASTGVPELLLVNPGNPDDSYLVRKIEGGPDIVGQRMPRGGDRLSDANIAKVREWIGAGAQQSAAVSTSAKVLKASHSKTDESVKVLLLLSGPLDKSTLSPEALLLSSFENGQRQIHSSNELAYTLEQNRLTLTLNTTHFTAKRFEIRFNSPEQAGVLDANGRLFDGDGDQRDGGAFVYSFTLSQ